MLGPPEFAGAYVVSQGSAAARPLASAEMPASIASQGWVGDPATGEQGRRSLVLGRLPAAPHLEARRSRILSPWTSGRSAQEKRPGGPSSLLTTTSCSVRDLRASSPRPATPFSVRPAT